MEDACGSSPSEVPPASLKASVVAVSAVLSTGSWPVGGTAHASTSITAIAACIMILSILSTPGAYGPCVTRQGVPVLSKTATLPSLVIRMMSIVTSTTSASEPALWLLLSSVIRHPTRTSVVGGVVGSSW